MDENIEYTDEEILELVINRIKNSKPMPEEFSKIIDEDFWDLVDKK